jgi:hypothetical protein
MIHHIIQMLSITEHYGQSELIEIAKGKYAIETKTKRVYKQAMRELYMKRALRNGTNSNS